MRIFHRKASLNGLFGLPKRYRVKCVSFFNPKSQRRTSKVCRKLFALPKRYVLKFVESLLALPQTYVVNFVVKFVRSPKEVCVSLQ